MYTSKIIWHHTNKKFKAHWDALPLHGLVAMNFTAKI